MKRSVVLAIILSICILSGTVQSQAAHQSDGSRQAATPQPTEPETPPSLALVMLVDNSESNLSNDAQGFRFQGAIMLFDYLRTYTDAEKQRYWVGYTNFPSRTASDVCELRDLYNSNQPDINECIRQFNPQNARGTTEFAKPLQDAQSIFRRLSQNGHLLEESRKVIILFTDAQPDEGSGAIEGQELKTYFEMKMRPIINTIRDSQIQIYIIGLNNNTRPNNNDSIRNDLLRCEWQKLIDSNYSAINDSCNESRFFKKIDDPSKLPQAYYEILNDILKKPESVTGSLTGQIRKRGIIPVKPLLDKVIFTFAKSTKDLQIDLYEPGSYEPVPMQEDTFYQIYSIPNPQSGNWDFVTNEISGTIQYWVDYIEPTLNLKRLENPDQGLLLTASMSRSSGPITDTTNLELFADIIRVGANQPSIENIPLDKPASGQAVYSLPLERIRQVSRKEELKPDTEYVVTVRAVFDSTPVITNSLAFASLPQSITYRDVTSTSTSVASATPSTAPTMPRSVTSASTSVATLTPTATPTPDPPSDTFSMWWLIAISIPFLLVTTIIWKKEELGLETPSITGVEPDTIDISQPIPELTIRGAHFGRFAIAQWNDVQTNTTWDGTKKIKVHITEEMLSLMKKIENTGNINLEIINWPFKKSAKIDIVYNDTSNNRENPPFIPHNNGMNRKNSDNTYYDEELLDSCIYHLNNSRDEGDIEKMRNMLVDISRRRGGIKFSNERDGIFKVDDGILEFFRKILNKDIYEIAKNDKIVRNLFSEAIITISIKDQKLHYIYTYPEMITWDENVDILKNMKIDITPEYINYILDQDALSPDSEDIPDPINYANMSLIWGCLVGISQYKDKVHEDILFDLCKLLELLDRSVYEKFKPGFSNYDMSFEKNLSYLYNKLLEVAHRGDLGIDNKFEMYNPIEDNIIAESYAKILDFIENAKIIDNHFTKQKYDIYLVEFVVIGAILHHIQKNTRNNNG